MLKANDALDIQDELDAIAEGERLKAMFGK